jgi:hypothetical protein
MPQLHLYVPDRVAAELRTRARARGLSVSRYLAALVQRELGQGWPEGFFEEVVGGWKGPRLRRPPQGKYERRESL